MFDGGTFPRRLESRAAFTVHVPKGVMTKKYLANLDCAYAKTDCDEMMKDEKSRKALRNLADKY